MVIIRHALCISGCAQGSSELYRQGAARDYRVPEGIDRHSVIHILDSRTFIFKFTNAKIQKKNKNGFTLPYYTVMTRAIRFSLVLRARDMAILGLAVTTEKRVL